MLTIMKDVEEFDRDEIIVELREDSLGKYHVFVFVSFQKTKHITFDDKEQAKKRYYKEVS